MLGTIKQAGFTINKSLPAKSFRMFDFPPSDGIYHNYAELTAELEEIQENYPDILQVYSIGSTGEGRDIWAVRFNSDLLKKKEVSSRPGIIFMGAHHARTFTWGTGI